MRHTATRRLERLERSQTRTQKTITHMTDAELLEIIGLGDNPTDEQLRAVAEGRHEQEH